MGMDRLQSGKHQDQAYACQGGKALPAPNSGSVVIGGAGHPFPKLQSAGARIVRKTRSKRATSNLCYSAGIT